MPERKKLIGKMNEVRQKMQCLWEKKQDTDLELLEIAAVFDELLNRYNRIHRKSERNE